MENMKNIIKNSIKDNIQDYIMDYIKNYFYLPKIFDQFLYSAIFFFDPKYIVTQQF